MHHEQDMRKMGGLAKALPFTWAMMLIGNLALTGVGIPGLGIGTAGFYSKDSIINAAFLSGTPIGTYAFVLTVVAALMTAFYSWRQFLMTFHGKYRGADYAHGDDHGHGHALELKDVHEPARTMLVPLGVLALGALVAGGLFVHYFIGVDAGAFWRGSVAVAFGHHEGEVPLWVELAPLVVTIAGFGIAYHYYIVKPELPAKMAARGGMLYTFLYRKWYFDEVYAFLFVRPAMRLGRLLWKWGDGKIIDGIGPDGVAARVLDAARGAVKLQSGYVYHYAFAMLIGVVAITSYFVIAGVVP
jgi:NADH-quinone oxidoreductase subunit L